MGALRGWPWTAAQAHLTCSSSRASSPWRGSSAVRFYGESQWKRQVDTIGAIRNSKVAMRSHTKLAEGETGTDNWGKPVNYWQTLWYSLGSFLLSKNDDLGNAYFMFNGGSGYDRIWWYDEYDHVDLGKAIGPYRVTTIASVNVYWREFERGYVYVNPTPNNVASVILPQASRQLMRGNMTSLPDSIPSVSEISLNGHHAAILLKTGTDPIPDTTAPSVPTGLVGVAVSSSQINLSWNPSTDNVGVMGYYVYLDSGATLAITSATSFTHSGLTAGTTYKYRVSAYDAVPNHSAWTATPVAVTTPPARPDTQAPSVPTGLVGTAVSPSQINLSWNPSTDNVGVAGYYVYLNNGATLAITSATSFTHSGLTAGTTYKYRVSAYDAVPNHSAWTATPVAVTTTPAGPDTQAPSVPIGLVGVAVSSSQISLSWTAATDNVGVTGYNVYRGGMQIATLGVVTTFQDTGLTASTNYSYTVRALDAAGNASGQSMAASATTQAQAPGTSVTLAWDAVTAASLGGYRIYYGTAPGTHLQSLGQGLNVGNVTTYTVTGLNSGTRYYFTATAYDTLNNESVYSNEIFKDIP